MEITTGTAMKTDSAGTTAGTVDLVLGRLFAALFTEVSAAALVRAVVTGGTGSCVMAPVGSVAFADVLDGRAPGIELVDLLDGLQPSDLHDAALIEAIAGWERISSLAAARQAGLIAELVRRREADRMGDFVGDEVASRLACTRSVGERMVDLARGLDRLPAVAAALELGAIDARKATALLDGVAHLPLDVATAIVDEVLPAAPEVTVPQLKARIRKVELRLDANAAEKRHARARAQRHVSLTPATDGMAWLSAFLPADQAMAAYTAIDALAAAAAPGDDRPIDARRADALADVLRRVLDSGEGPGGLLPMMHRRRPHLHVTAAATTLLGLDEAPGELAGYGPIPASMARAIATDATWRRIFTDPATGELTGIGPSAYRPGADLTGFVLARDVTCTFPGCRLSAWRCQLDHRIAFDHAQPGHDQTTCENLQALCQHHHLLKTFAGWHVTKHVSTGDTDWTAPTGHVYSRRAISLQDTDGPESPREHSPNNRGHSPNNREASPDDSAGPPGGGTPLDRVPSDEPPF